MSLSFHVQARRDAFDLDVSVSTSAASLGLVGPSGAGKTTLLMALAGLIAARSLRLVVDGRTIIDTLEGLSPPAHRRGVGYVFQDGRLFPHLTVAGNVGFASRYADAPMSVEAALALVDLSGFETRWPASLSGGEARRVAIARALLPHPRLLLLDEPFAGLDVARRDRLMDHLVRLRDEVRTPMILVTHDRRDVERLCADVVVLEGGRRLTGRG